MYKGDTPTIGSSSIAAILGMSKWAGPWDVWADMHGLTERTGSNAMARGHILENAIAEHYAGIVGCTLAPGPTIDEAPVIGPEPWMHARPDRYVTLGKEKYLLEVKSTRSFSNEWGPVATDQVPGYYLCQVVWQMAVCDYDMTDLAAFATFTDEYRSYRIRRDQKVEQGITTFAKNWYEKHVIEGVPPQLDGSPACTAALVSRHPASNKKYVGSTKEDIALASDLFKVRQDIKDLTTEKSRIENALKERIGDNHGLSGVATWSSAKPSRRINTKALKEEMPDIAEKYTTEGKASRRFTFTYQPEE